MCVYGLLPMPFWGLAPKPTLKLTCVSNSLFSNAEFLLLCPSNFRNCPCSFINGDLGDTPRHKLSWWIKQHKPGLSLIDYVSIETENSRIVWKVVLYILPCNFDDF